MSSNQNKFIKSYYVRLFGLEEAQSHVKKPKLVFLHGLLGNSLNWVPVIKSLTDHFEVASLDLLGHGKTEKKGDSYKPEEFCEGIEVVREEMGWDKISLVGHSLGARVAFVYASMHPENLDKVVFEDMGPHKTGSASKGTSEMISKVPVPFPSKAEAREYFDGDFKRDHGKTMADYMYSNIQKRSENLYDWRFDRDGALKILEIGAIYDFWKEFKAVQCPNLIIRGENSHHLPKEIYERMLKENKNSSGVEIAEAGHWVHFEQKKAFEKALKDFLIT